MTDTSLSSPPAVQGEFEAGGVFGRSWRVLLRHLVPFVGVIALADAPQNAGFLLQATLGPEIASLLKIAGGLLSVVAQGFVLQGAAQACAGVPVDLGAALRRGAARFPALLGTSLLLSMATALGLVLLVVPGVFILVVLFAALPACVVEGLGPIACLKRSAELTRGLRWRTLGAVLLIVLGGAVLLTIATLGLGAVSGLLLHGLGRSALVAENLLGFVLGSVFSAFLMVGMAVTHHELRAAKEGIGSERLAGVFD